MMRFDAAVVVLAAGLGAGAAWSQEAGAVWVQIEALPTLGSAQDRVRAWEARLPDVNGFYLGTGWYGIALGPYPADEAARVLATLRGTGVIPSDSYVSDGAAFRQQFWPVGAGLEAATEAAPEAAPEPEPAREPDETEAEARESEAALSRPEKELLQIALQWAGFYDSTIDGAFGRGTRSAMSAWQEARGLPATGILTTRQRDQLIAEYNAPLEGLGLQTVRDDAAGIEILMPTEVVAFAAYEPPFARYDAKGEIAATVLLISQPGDQTRLFGLYEILQTLEAVPTSGERARGDDSFVIDGQDSRNHTHVSVSLENGEIKGFALIWPAGDDERRTRVLQMMQASFQRLPGVLDPGITRPGEDQAVDLVSGLAVRQPRLSRSGFFIDGAGTVLTTTEAVDECTEITLDVTHPATVALRDDALGLAVLRPTEALAPLATARFQTAVPRLQAEVAVAGYPYGSVLATPALTFGRLADIRGLNGEEEIKRLDLIAQEGDAGGPVFDNGGAVLGMLLPRAEGTGQVLPPEVSFVLDAETILTALSGAGISAETTDSITFMPPEALTRAATSMTVLVSCW